MTEYYYLVLTSPEKVFHNVSAVKEYLEHKNYYSWLIRSELGQGDNPHVNVVVEVNTGIRTDNIKRDIMKAYYGQSFLEKHKNNKPFKLHGCKGKKVVGELQLSYICVYLNKEISYDYDYFHNINIAELSANLPTYEEHRATYDAGKIINLSFEKLLTLCTETYTMIHFENNLKKYDENDILPPPSYDDFKTVLKRLFILKYNLIPIFNKMKPFYIQWSGSLGNYDAMENYIDRMEQDIKPKREFFGN